MQMKEHEPMSKHLTFRIGGEARFFVEVKTVDELKEAIAFAQEKKLPWFVLGGGSNTLCADKGYDGVVIQMANRGVTIDGDRLIAGAGAISVAVARMAGDAGLSGLEWMVSLPGTIGGAVRGNAGCFGGETRDAVESVRVLRDGAIVEVTNADCQFAYRESVFKHNTDIIIDVTFKLAPGSKEEIKAKMDAVLAKRKSTQPSASGTAGCAFKNVEFKDLSEIATVTARGEVPQNFLSKGQLGSGWIIDQLDLKGKKIGGISISPVHGNFLINDGTATADDVLQLLSFIKTRARDELGVQLHEEIQYLGF